MLFMFMAIGGFIGSFGCFMVGENLLGGLLILGGFGWLLLAIVSRRGRQVISDRKSMEQ
jgi:hypothetical protein